MHGSFESNEAYRSKEGQLSELGKRPTQGTHTDLLHVTKLLDNGYWTTPDGDTCTVADENEEHFGTVMKFPRSMNEYSDYKRRKLLQNDRSQPEVYIRWGPPGTGKTRWVDDTYGTN